MKKLIIFSYDFPPSNGGIARLCQEIAVGMQKHYEKVTVVTRDVVGQNIPYNFSGIEVVKLPSKRIRLEKVAYNYFKTLEDKESVDVLCGVWHPEATICHLAAIKNVYVLGHGTEFLFGKSIFRKRVWLPFYAKWVLKKSKLIIANSNYTKDLILKIDKSISVIALPLAVNQNFFKPIIGKKDNSKFKICSLSRIFQFKGYDFIAKTLAGLPPLYREKIQWNIGGTGPYLNELKVLIDNLGIKENVCFLGFIQDSELPTFYNQNDVFILCTREDTDSTSVEGFGLVFLEAQSCGIPVIGTSTGGISDAVSDNNGGWLIEQDNELQLRELLVKLIEDTDIIKIESLKARDRVLTECTWDLYCENLFDRMNIKK